MKHKNAIILLIISLVALLIVVGVFYFKQYFPKYKWRPIYSYTSEEPYGTSLIYNQLEDKFSEKDFVLLTRNPSKIINEEETNSIIFYIGYGAYYDSLSIEWFKSYMKKGNKLCIASETLPFQLLNNIYGIDSSLFYVNEHKAKTINTHFTKNDDRKYNFHFQQLKDTADYEWSYLSKVTMEEYWRNYLYKPYSVFDSSKVNFVKIAYGKGELYIYTTPILLTNYYFITEQGFDYSRNIFTEMGEFDKFYWDDFSRLTNRGNSRNSLLNNPLEFILKNPALRWAWYLILLGILFFILFKLKRQQNPIPLIRQDKNTTIEYAKAVGLLHYKTSSYTDLSNRLMKLFQYFITARYGINLSMEKEEQIHKLTLVSGLTKKRIENIYKIHFKIKYNPEPEVNQTLLLHSELEYFYKNCK